jgi:hypothetical protein
MFSSLRLYPSDLSDHEWEILAPLIPSVKSLEDACVSGQRGRSQTPSSTEHSKLWPSIKLTLSVWGCRLGHHYSSKPVVFAYQQVIPRLGAYVG